MTIASDITVSSHDPAAGRHRTEPPSARHAVAWPV